MVRTGSGSATPGYPKRSEVNPAWQSVPLLFSFPRPMISLRTILTVTTFFFAFCFSLRAQTETGVPLEITGLTPESRRIYNLETKTGTGTNGVMVVYKDVVLAAESISLNQVSGEAVADGNVRILQDDHVWAGEHIVYNFFTHQMVSQEFRTGKVPTFAE